jgi:hypothetical protein
MIHIRISGMVFLYNLVFIISVIEILELPRHTGQSKIEKYGCVHFFYVCHNDNSDQELSL